MTQLVCLPHWPEHWHWFAVERHHIEKYGAPFMLFDAGQVKHEGQEVCLVADEHEFFVSEVESSQVLGPKFDTIEELWLFVEMTCHIEK